MAARRPLREKPAKSASIYAPEFHNPVALPTIEQFKLDHILANDVLEESAAVALALLKVQSNYQQDLKLQIKKTLAVEQKIQYKNINLIKKAHALHKDLHSRQRKLQKAVQNDRNHEGVDSKVDSVLHMTIDVSSSVQQLLHRMTELDRKHGGPGLPDPSKYPRLNRILGSLSALAKEASSTETEVVSPSKRRSNHETHTNGSLNGVNGDLSHSKVFHDGFSNDADAASSEIHSLTAMSLPEISPAASNESPQTPEALASPRIEMLDLEIDADAFELFMDTNIAKYRQKMEHKYQQILESREELVKLDTIASNAPRTPKNPLKLLYNGTPGSDFALDLPDSETLRTPFLSTKSIATVLETPQLSLHKKLRINALPLLYKKSSGDVCDCSKADTASDVTAEGPSRELDLPDLANDEIWSSSELQIDTEENESEASSATLSSDAESSLDSFDGNIGDTNNYYVSLQHTIKQQRKKKRSRRPRLDFTAETSPTPKHQPLHRILKPKQSILKLTNAPVAPKLTPETPTVVEGKNLYMASPRGSFINPVSAVGLIVGSSPSEGIGSDGDLEDNDTGFEPEDGIDELSDEEGKDGELQAISRLKSLLI